MVLETGCLRGLIGYRTFCRNGLELELTRGDCSLLYRKGGDVDEEVRSGDRGLRVQARAVVWGR